MTNSAAEMSGASKKVFRAHPRQVWRNPEVVGATKKFFRRIQEMFERIQEMFERNQEMFGATKKVFQAHPRVLSLPVWYILPVKVKPHKQLRRYLCLFKA